MGLQWFLPDSCCGWTVRQIEQSFLRYCRSRPGCLSTCYCPSVIGKSHWMAVWQTPHHHKKTEEWSSRGAWSVARWTFFDHLLNQKYSKSHPLLPWWRHGSESFDVTYRGHLHLALLTSSLLLLLLFCETIHPGEGCHVKTVFRGFDAKGKRRLQRKQTERVPVCVHEWPKQYRLPVDKLMMS